MPYVSERLPLRRALADVSVPPFTRRRGRMLLAVSEQASKEVTDQVERFLTPSDDPQILIPRERPTGYALGIDVGGTGVKAALVDLATGRLASDQVSEDTPRPATPDAVIDTISSIVDRAIGSDEPRDLRAGCGLPGVVKHGRLMTAANIDKEWIEFPVEQVLTDRLGRPVLALNDADAAGVAELAYGEAEGKGGTVILLTIGTGVGTALFIDGHLVPNTELGHLEMYGQDAETLVSGVSRERRGLDWEQWAKEFNDYLAMIERYFWPDLIILGGGVSKGFSRYGSYLRTRAPLVTARLLNTAGIVGAALAGAMAARTTQRA